MIRARFYANLEDCRPVKWPFNHPYWRSGENDAHSIIVAYADSEDQIVDFWPEAKIIWVQERDSYLFTDRFPKPDWLDDALQQKPDDISRPAVAVAAETRR